ncbi:MAG: glycerate kinase type-2 family protein [Nitrososphaerales archaeon]
MSKDRVKRDVRRALDQAVLAADPKSIIKSKLKLRKDTLTIGSFDIDLSKYNRIFIIGGGKASAFMAAEIEKLLGRRITSGVVNYPDYLKPPKLRRIRLNPASHPVPNQSGVKGVEQMLKIADSLTAKDLFICLISGGASSLMPLPIQGVTLADVQKVTSILLKSGAEIHEINTVRKHISGVKGGRLAEKLQPATILSLIISDVVDDDLCSIASGPTTPDPTTCEDAKHILQKYEIWDRIPARVRLVIESKKETPKQESKIFRRVRNFLIGSNKQSCLAAAEALRKSGYKTIILSTSMQGDAKQIGELFSAIVSDMHKNGLPFTPPAAVVAGGETTVKVTGKGLGGRNQELALAASLGIRGLENVAIASIGTDGVDGPTDAAGAIVDGNTASNKESAKRYLENNDSYHFFKKTGDLIITGPTGTNVNDIIIGAALK